MSAEGARALRRRADLRVVGLTFAAVFVIAASPVALGLTWFGRDLHLLDMGVGCAVKDALAAGGLWVAATLGNGQPLFADPAAQLLYPLRWIAWLFSAQVGASLVVALHLAGGAASVAWLLRTFHARPTVAAAGALAWITCGTSVDLIGHSVYLADLVWLPLLWAAARATLGRRVAAARGVLLLAAAGALCLLAGEPQGFAVAATFAVAEAALRARQAPRRALLVVGGVLLAPLLAAPALVPAWLEAQWTARNWHTLNWLSWSADAKQLAGLLLPIDLQERMPGGQILGTAFDPDPAAWNFTPYLGVSLLAFALLGAGRRAKVATAAALVAFACAFAEWVPLLPLLGKVVPFVDDFRYPQKYLLPASLAVVVLAFRGLRHRRAPLAAGGALALVLVLTGLLFGFAPAAFRGALTSAAMNATGVALLVLVVVVLARRRPDARSAVPWVLALSVAIPALGFLPLGPRVDEAALRAGARGFEGVVCETVSSRLGGTERTRESRGWSEYQGGWIAGQCNLAACHGLRKARIYSALYPRVQAELESRHFDNPRYQRSIGCTHRTDLFRTEGGPPQAVLVPIPAPAPEVLAAGNARVVDEDEVAAAVLAAEDPLLLLSHPDGPPPEIPPAGLAGSLRRHKPHALDLVLDDGQAGPGVTVVNQAFFRGWSATQGGQEVPVLRAGGGLLAVVARGEGGVVELRYQPPGLWIGLGIALLGLLAAAAVSVAARRAG